MREVIAILVALLLGIAQTTFAAGVALTDSEMDQVAAGDWVVIPSGFEAVDVYNNNNTLDLEDEAQSTIQAVNNANTVDSAIAVQTNIASVSGNPSSNVGVNGTNKADILNYNPADSGSGFESSSASIFKSGSESTKAAFDFLEATEEESHFTKFATETLFVDETLKIAKAEASASSSECKKNCDGTTVSAFVYLEVYDYDLDYSKEKSVQKWHSSSHLKAVTEESADSSSFKFSKTTSHKSGRSFRKNLSENNHLDLEDSSQVHLQAVSNLNAVGSGAAMQTNIASNVGVQGTITHVNVAQVVNGL